MTDESFIDATLVNLSARPIDRFGKDVNDIAKSFILRLPYGLTTDIDMIALIRAAVVSGSLLSSSESGNKLTTTRSEMPALPPQRRSPTIPPPLPPPPPPTVPAQTRR